VTPDNALAHYNLGNLYWQGGTYDAAIAAYERALAIEPDDEDALFNLAVTYVAKGDLERALPQLQSLSQRIPESSQVWRELGRVYAAKGMVDESREAFAREAALSAQQRAPAPSGAPAP
jgi:predicted Zn-dependent protease